MNTTQNLQNQLAEKMKKGEVTVSDINKNKGKFDQTYMTDEFLQQMAGNTPINAVPADNSLTTKKYADKSVTLDKLSFTKKSKNLFNGYINGMVVVETSLDLNTMYTRSSYSIYDGRTAVIPIKPNTNYTFKIHETDVIKSNILRVGFSRTYPTFESDPGAGSRNYIAGAINNTGGTIKEQTIKSKEDSNYLIIYVSNDGQEPLMQVEEGTTVSKLYEAHSLIPAEMVGERVYPKDYFKYDVRTKLGNAAFLTSMNGTIDYDLNGKRIFFPAGSAIFSGRKWIRITSTSSGGIYYNFPVTVGSAPVYMFANIDSDNDALDFRFVVYTNLTAGVPENYVLVAVLSQSNVYANGQYTVNGRAPLPGKSITENMLDDALRGKLGGASGSTNKYLYYDELRGKYQTAPYVENNTVDVRDFTVESFYQLYDDLMAANPEYISKKIIGYSGTAERTDDTSLPIYEYSFSPRRADIDIDDPAPIMLVQSAIHGNERIGAYATYLFFKDICENHITNEQLEFLRYNIDFKVLPIAGPYSFEHNQRKTAAGVDPNRNFDTDWFFVEDDGNPTGLFAGDAPMTEVETRYIDQWLASYKGKAFALIDMHNVSGSKVISQGQVSMCWLISGDEQVKKMARNVMTANSRKWYKEVSGLEVLPSDTLFGYVNSAPAGTTRNQAFKKYGIKSITVDPCWTWYHVLDVNGNRVKPTAKKDDNEALLVSMDSFGGIAYGMIKHFAE
ncbi:M14 family metallopeptidase [Sporosarcina jiandibaonis]|uniref:M14 family metallopeptidase n=1 Tax=Sporosarcina jiandibaonis TaxID=2715535 RepID=UPI001557BEB1|nr:M14 family metallopeptidase [Sporosarcina jiandibaonis]